MDAEGRIGLQVHSGRCDVRWRNLRIADLGPRSKTVLLGPDRSSGDQVIVEPATGITSIEDGWRIEEDGVAITSTRSWQDGPSGLRIEATIERGAIRLVLGD